MKPRGKTYTIGQFARELEIHPDTVRSWIERGHISEPDRDRKGWRIFNGADLKRAKKHRDRWNPRPSRLQKVLHLKT